jgi:hypothetical protein
MKVAIIGSTCSGKTTALAYLTCNLGGLRKKVGIGQEVAVDCPYPLNESGGFLTQWWILSHQIEREQRFVTWFPNVVVDRGALDSVVYALVAKEQGRITEEEFSVILETAKAWMKAEPYDAFIYLTPLENVLLTDKAKNFQTKVDSAFKLVFSLKEVTCNVPIYTVSAQDKDNRNNAVFHIIKEIMGL